MVGTSWMAPSGKPAERKPATYAFDRLPSQQAQPQREQMLEDAARGAIEAAGFTPAADAASVAVVSRRFKADIVVLLGRQARVSRRGAR